MNIKQKRLDTISLIVFMILGVLSYVLGFGWIRLLFGLVFFAFKGIILAYGIWYLLNYQFVNSKLSRRLYYITLSTYLTFNLFCLDGADIGGAYCFFRLIVLDDSPNNFLDDAVVWFSGLSAVVSILCLIISIVIIKREKKKSSGLDPVE